MQPILMPRPLGSDRRCSPGDVRPHRLSFHCTIVRQTPRVAEALVEPGRPRPRRRGRTSGTRVALRGSGNTGSNAAERDGQAPGHRGHAPRRAVCCRRVDDRKQHRGVRPLVSLTGERDRGCNERVGPEFVSSRRPAPSVLATAETPSSVPPDSLIGIQPEGLRFVRASPIVDLTLDNLAEPSQTIDEDAPACAGVA